MNQYHRCFWCRISRWIQWYHSRKQKKAKNGLKNMKMQKKGKSIGWMIKTCPQISAPKLKIFTYSESASHFRLNGVKISLLMDVFFVLLLLLLLTFFITHPILFLFSPFFCFLAHFSLFFCSMSDTIWFSTKFYIRNTSDIGLFIWMSMFFSWF